MRRKILAWIIRKVPREDISFIVEEFFKQMRKRHITEIKISNCQGKITCNVKES